MALLFYKQRFKQPNKGNTPGSNAAHAEYIATRPRVYIERDGEHGLFSNVTTDLDAAKRLVREKSLEHKNIYRTVISFSRETANELELSSKAEWEAFFKAHSRLIAEGNGIKQENFRWFAAAHNEGDHPHVHVIFWDDAQTVMKNKVSPEIPKGIRSALIKEVFSEKILEFTESKWLAFADLRGMSGVLAARADDDGYISTLAEKLIDGYAPLKNAFDAYVAARLDMSALYVGEEMLETIKPQIEMDAMRIISKSLLFAMRKSEDDYRELAAFELAAELVSALRRAMADTRADASRLFGRELSKQARRERALEERLGRGGEWGE
ncbi:hypothetical protein FACS189425_05830 [Clostridia bacterium]|nr:hypothetical protein FACS189425_05830 [Clostridia bacterium]